MAGAGAYAAAALMTTTTKGARSRRFFHLRLHDLDMEGSVMCRLRADFSVSNP